jgi:hypothetical protein
MARVLIGGSREASVYMGTRCVARVIRLDPTKDTLIVGGARGIDEIALGVAKEFGIPYRVYLPDYDQFGRRAPLQRNELMASICDRAEFFWDGRSRGTWHAINEVRKRGLPLEVFVLGHKVEDVSTLKLEQPRHPRKEVALL